ncbi:T Cell Receptor Alpha Variable 14/Delta Variable 4, partial [Manis pentadactyla]
SSNTKGVYQSTNAVHKQEGGSVALDCTVTVSFTYFVMYWYRQLSSGEITYIIQLYSENSSFRTGRYSVVFQKPSKALKLTISALTHGDSAVYFCAVRDSTDLTLGIRRSPHACIRPLEGNAGLAKSLQVLGSIFVPTLSITAGGSLQLEAKTKYHPENGSTTRPISTAPTHLGL